MAIDPSSTELGMTTNVEAARAKPTTEAISTQLKDNLGVGAALGALRKDNPQEHDRTDLANLANAETNKHGATNEDESKKIYSEPYLDPKIGEMEKRIVTNTNLDPKVKEALSNGSMDYMKIWYQTNRELGLKEYLAFVQNFPEKAAAYADQDAQVRFALDVIRQQQEAQAKGQDGTASADSNEAAGQQSDVQAESNQLLADSVGVSQDTENTQPQENEALTGNEVVDSSEQKPVPTESEKGENKELLQPEMAGAQAILLLEEKTQTLDKTKIEEALKNDPPKTERTTKLSKKERWEYWNGKDSPYRNLTFDQQMEKWSEGMNKFFAQYKDKPQAEFFKRMGVDLNGENVPMAVYERFFDKGKGDVGLFVLEIAKANSNEQIQENMDLIRDFAGMYGKDSSRITQQMILGYKNAQTDMESFVKSAQEAIDKGANMPGADLVRLLLESENENQKNDKAEKNAEENEIKNIQKNNWDIVEEIGKLDANHNQGSLGIEGNLLTINPNITKVENPYQEGTTEYDFFEKYQTKYKVIENPKDADDLIKEQRKRVPIGIELATATEADGNAKAELTPVFWEIINANPNKISRNPFVETVTVGDKATAKSLKPVEIKVKDREGDVDVSVNYLWNRVRIDKVSLPIVQQKAIEFLEQQVAQGLINEEELTKAKNIIESHESKK